MFSDDIRDGIKGSVFDIKDRGFATGKTANTESVKFGIVASLPHLQIDMSKVNYSKEPYASSPANVITYAECHDNNILWDKIALSVPDASEEERKKMHELALTIVLTSQGIPFLHAGSEFLRSKFGEENSYNKGDSVNAIRWGLKTKNLALYQTVASLIKMRKEHGAFRLTSSRSVNNNIRFLDTQVEGVIAYKLDMSFFKETKKETWSNCLIIFNGTSQSQTIQIPGEWKLVNKGKALSDKMVVKQILVNPREAIILAEVPEQRQYYLGGSKE